MSNDKCTCDLIKYDGCHHADCPIGQKEMETCRQEDIKLLLFEILKHQADANAKTKVNFIKEENLENAYYFRGREQALHDLMVMLKYYGIEGFYKHLGLNGEECA